MMGAIFTLDWEVEHPQTLFIFEDGEVASSHAKEFCKRAGLEYNTRNMRAKREANGRIFRWGWGYKVDTATPWHYRYSGLQLSTIVYHCYVEREAHNFLLTRLRGNPLKKTDDGHFDYAVELLTRDYNNEVSRIH